MRIVWLFLGLTALMLAGAGVVLPLLPATPFVILAAFCFARSSPALHDRLHASRTFGKAIRDWRTHRAISRKGKTASVLAMALRWPPRSFSPSILPLSACRRWRHPPPLPSS